MSSMNKVLTNLDVELSDDEKAKIGKTLSDIINANPEGSYFWKPTVAADGTISWVLSDNIAVAPTPQNVKGPQGYSVWAVDPEVVDGDETHPQGGVKFKFNYQDPNDEGKIKTASYTVWNGEKGDIGNEGPQGPALNVTTTSTDDGTTVTFDDKAKTSFTVLNGVNGAPGEKGEPGAGLQIAGSVNTYSELPSDLTEDDAGKAYFNQDDGKLYIWTGAAWPAEGEGSQFKGDAGLDALECGKKFTKDSSVIGADSALPITDFNRIPKVGDYFLNIDDFGNLSTFYVFAVDGTNAKFRVVATVNLKGKKGDTGASGVSPTLTQTQTTNGYKIAWTDATNSGEFILTNGDQGLPGKSAYEIAKEGGYPGSEEDWLKTLVGPAGAAGTDGKAGVDGADGKSVTVTLTGVGATPEHTNGGTQINFLYKGESVPFTATTAWNGNNGSDVTFTGISANSAYFSGNGLSTNPLDFKTDDFLTVSHLTTHTAPDNQVNTTTHKKLTCISYNEETKKYDTIDIPGAISFYKDGPGAPGGDLNSSYVGAVLTNGGWRKLLFVPSKETKLDLENDDHLVQQHFNYIPMKIENNDSNAANWANDGILHIVLE